MRGTKQSVVLFLFLEAQIFYIFSLSVLLSAAIPHSKLFANACCGISAAIRAKFHVLVLFLRFHYYLFRFRCFAPPLHYVYFFIGLHFVSPNAINFATSWLLYFVKIFNSFFNNYVFNIRFLRSRLYWVLIFSHTLRSYGTIKNFKISDKSRLVPTTLPFYDSPTPKLRSLNFSQNFIYNCVCIYIFCFRFEAKTNSVTQNIFCNRFHIFRNYKSSSF